MIFNDADKVYAGSQEVDEIYAGSSLIWQNIVVPEAPFINSLTVLNGTQIQVNFSQGSDGGGTISDYEFNLNDGAFTSSGQTTSPITISGLANGTSYSIKIRAINEAGASNDSNTESATTWSVPSAPNLTAVDSPTTSSLRLVWTAGANGGTAITNYQYRIGSGSWINMGTSSPFTRTSLSAYSTYSFTIRAVNAVGVSAASNSRSGTTKMWATGGSIIHSGGWRIHRFSSSGTLSVSGGGANVQYLVVAGGAGGGGSRPTAAGGGGGGAGAMRTGSHSLGGGNNPIVIGGGGSGAGAHSHATGGNGANSAIPGLGSAGGGGGGREENNIFMGGQGNNGGSGGGAGAAGFWGFAQPGWGSTGGNRGGYSGGNGVQSTYDFRGQAAGGGGAGGVGGESNDTHNGSPGGGGANSAITGTNTTYAWGGRGGGAIGHGPHGTAGRGAGGGGAWGNSTLNGGNGGSGYVVVRYPL